MQGRARMGHDKTLGAATGRVLRDQALHKNTRQPSLTPLAKDSSICMHDKHACGSESVIQPCPQDAPQPVVLLDRPRQRHSDERWILQAQRQWRK
jgi:hypothetical protein